jgi:hypothetical protein
LATHGLSMRPTMSPRCASRSMPISA